MIIRTAALLVVAAWAAGLFGAVRAQTAIASLAVPDRINQFATLASDGAFVAITWAASTTSGATDIYAALSRDGGVSFSNTVRVNAVSGQARVNGEQPPRVALKPRGKAVPEVVVVWTAPGASGTSLVTARSTDGARSFGPTAAVPGAAAAGTRGWESIATDRQGRTVVLWLDHRDTASAGGTTPAAHDHHAASASATAPPQADGVARAQLSQIYVGSLDGTVTARSVARGVCYCCKTAVAFASDTMLVAAWRHVYTGNRRDIAYAVSRDLGRTFSEPVRVSEDNWQLDGCPENGPTLAVDAQQRVHVVWPTLVRDGRSETLKLFHAMTTDGRTFTRRVSVPTIGPAYHPQMVTGRDGALVLVWEEAVEGQRLVRFASSSADPGSLPRFTATTLATSPTATFPAAASVSSTHALVAWTSRQDGRSGIALARVPTRSSRPASARADGGEGP